MPPPPEPSAEAASARDAERWFRSRGLPFFAHPGSRGTLLVARTAPVIALLCCVELAGSLLQRTSISIDARAPLPGAVVLVAMALGLLVLVAIPAAALLAAGTWLREWPRSTTTAGWVLIVYDVVVAPWVVGHPFALLDHLAAGLSVALALLATRLGVGSLASWTMRSAIRQLRALPQLASRALPLLMLVVVVSFFSRNLWEVVNALPAVRLAGVVWVFALLGLLFIVPVTRTELIGLGNAADATPELSRLERVNVTVVLVLAQSLQVVIFSGLVCVFFTGLGSIAFTPAVLDVWLGPGRAPLELAGVRLPVDAALVKTAVFLSCVSSLNFLISATTTASYRSAFYDPLFDDAKKALAVRAHYRWAVRLETGQRIVAERE
ncbi:hypothetical protein [Subtercola boreus]|uniref:Integral membrane protein n=1 Tax=Subtercola boreus TaxID=120213 RepID=A0A3E0W830_9MICO|nr:hypothetical protein [Subtercola boreus]RFA17951.1 hypothetical protein B7R24_14900 [Subtercola boreus]RFA18333.1 hypothetical protein B7R23_14935 [Subtercola boreus]RFA24863.1 hypothetical protein B7R25_14930 [Subtercola boreus]